MPTLFSAAINLHRISFFALHVFHNCRPVIVQISFFHVCYCVNITAPLIFVYRNSCEFPRSWLLPVMRDHVRETDMMFFFENLMPLSNAMREKGKQETVHIAAMFYNDISYKWITHTFKHFININTTLLQIDQKLSFNS